MLATRSNFSIGESILTIEKLVEIATAAGQKAVAITDTMSVTALIDFTNKAKKAGIKPIIGCRLRFVDNVAWRKVKGVKEKVPPEFFLTYYVLSEKGLLALFKLLTLANTEEHFYNVPKLGFDDLYKALETLTSDDVAIASGDVYSVLHHKNSAEILRKISDALSASNVFLTLTPINTPLFDTLNKKAIALAAGLGLQTIVTRPVNYGEGDADAAEVMNAITKQTVLSSIWHQSPAHRDAFPMIEAGMSKECIDAAKRLIKRGVVGAGPAFMQGLRSAAKLVDMVTYEWKKAPISLPKMAENEFLSVVEECKKGWARRFASPIFGDQPTQEDLRNIYMPRLRYELEVLKKLNFSGYFLLTFETVNFAKSNGILVGPGRGSIGGSLVAYLMGITDCDPIRFGLLFERFINPDRIDLPDADLDFMASRREEVIKFLTDKFGRGRVAAVSNFNALGTASAIRDVGKAFELPEFETACSKFAPKEHGMIIKLEKAAAVTPEIDAFRLRNPAVWSVCAKLEGQLRNLAKHAAGIIVGGVDIVERAVVERRKGEMIVCWDKRIVEDQGLVKMDLLGLSTLDLISLAARKIEERQGKKIDLLRIDLYDPEVLDNFAKAHTTGVFQFGSGGIKKLLKDLGRDGTITFEDITAATALYRPGPMDSGMMDSYWRRKQGIEEIDIDHPNLRDVVMPTFGVLVYQEQVMKAAVVVAGYTLIEADKLRKIMGKKLPEEMAKERSKFVAGCMSNAGMAEDDATAFFDKIEKFAAYGFNRSHSVEYSLISYQCMWLKTHYPVEFMAAALSLQDKEEELPALLKEAARLGVTVRTPDVNLSTETFKILSDTELVIPFTKIKGLTTRTATAILEARTTPFTSKEDMVARVNKTICNKAKIESLDKIGAFCSIEPTQPPINDPSRVKDQIDLIPGLITDYVPVARLLNLDKFHKTKILEIVHEYMRDQEEDNPTIKPLIGKTAKFMVITDAATKGEDEHKQCANGRSFASVNEALTEAGLSRADGYWTSLVKRQKEGKQVSTREISTYMPYLMREIEAMKPPAIVLLGSTIVRQFIPDFKGKASDQAGKVIYDKARDVNFVVGFNPAEIFYAPEKQAALNAVFATARELSVH